MADSPAKAVKYIAYIRPVFLLRYGGYIFFYFVLLVGIGKGQPARDA